MSSARRDKLAELKAARAGGGRAKQWESESKDLYDEVDEEDYRKVVTGRLAQDDFIEDDDGGGYADDGREDWGEGGRESEEEEDEEDEKERAKRKASKKAAKAKAAKSKPVARALPPPSASAYRPAIDPRKEEDFMSSLFDGLDDQPASSRSRPTIPSSPMSRKRASSPDFLSSSTNNGLSSDGAASDDSFLGLRGGDWRGPEKKPRLDKDERRPSKPQPLHKGGRSSSVRGVKKEDVEVPVKLEEDVEMRDGFGMQIPGSPDWPDMEPDGNPSPPPLDLAAGGARKPKKEQSVEEEEDEDEEMEIKPKLKNGSINSASLNKTQPKRQYVNASSVSTKSYLPPSAVASSKPQDNVLRPRPKYEDPDAPPSTPAWLKLADDLALPDSSPSEPVAPSSDAPSSPPRRKTKAEKDAPPTTDIAAYEEDGTTLRMFWLDYHELETRVGDIKSKELWLFGKVWDRDGGVGKKGKWVSCCLKVDGLERNLYVCPRDKSFINGRTTDVDVEERDVERELDRLRKDHGIGSLMSKWVNRNYVFGVEGVPTGESKWLKVVYPYDDNSLPTDLSGNTFSHVLGTNTSAFEMFVVKRKIMGPCWLEIKDCQLSAANSSWCKLEVSVADPKNVRPLTDSDGIKEMPPLTIMSLSARTVVNHKENNREVVCVAARAWENCSIDNPSPPERLPSSIHTVVRPLGNWPPGFKEKASSQKSRVITAANEAALLSVVLANIVRLDPDVIVGHDFLNVSLEVILQRMGKHRTGNWSKIGRFKKKGTPPVSNRFGGIMGALVGRLVCDLTSDGAKIMIPSTTWSLTEMCRTQLKFEREDIDPDDTHSFFDDTVSSPERLLRFVRHCEADAFFQMGIASKVQLLPLMKQLTVLAGNSWNRTLNGGRAERIEYMLLHEFHRLKYICPDKFSGKNKAAIVKAEVEEGDGAAAISTKGKGGKRDKYKGGLVFEPKRGLWDKFVLVMDFNSLYPSIIQEYNIDFTTLSVATEEDADGDEKMPDVPSPDAPQGVVPRIISTLVARRREVKGLMKGKGTTEVQMMQYNIRQLALKLTANSMYGCLGFEYSRFYARPLAALTTYKGREILTSTKELAESVNLEVVYGDTDSVFVNSNVTDYAEAIKISNLFKKQVNDKYKQLEIDLDGVFQRLLLLQKKKYAAVVVASDGTTSTEIKGLDMKRREFCKLSKDVSQYVLDRVLSGEDTEVCISKIHEYLSSVNEKVREGHVDLDDFIINKRLGKNPEDYPDARNQPQVQVALRIKARGGSARAGDVIQYIFCTPPDGKTARSAQAENAYHPDELRKQPELRIDYEYYLSLQVLPPIERLCEPIEGTDRARLAECLGLDPERYATKAAGGDVEREFTTLGSQISDKERFADSTPLELRCMHCEHTTLFGGLLNDTDKIILPDGPTCPQCHLLFAPASFAIQLENQIRSHVSKYYRGTMICDDQSCGTSVRAMGVYGRRCMVSGCKGSMHLAYTDAALYNQLLFYASLFDHEKAIRLSKSSPQHEMVEAIATRNIELFNYFQAVVRRYIDKNGRGCVEMRSIFSFM